MRGRGYITGALLLLTLWAVSGGDEKGVKAGVKSALTAADVGRLKTVLAPGWDLKDPLVTSYAVLSHTILNIELPRSAVSYFHLLILITLFFI